MSAKISLLLIAEIYSSDNEPENRKNVHWEGKTIEFSETEILHIRRAAS